MKYQISVPDPSSFLIEIVYTVAGITSDHIEIQLPSWRPGRYEIQNFAKKIQRMHVTDPGGAPVRFQKITKDRWRIFTGGAAEIRVHYHFYANTQDAGSSYVDAELWYLNFINFCFYTEGRMEEPCVVALDIPETFRIACGMRAEGAGILKAADYYQLVDSPLLASATIQHKTYQVRGVNFHVWMHGALAPNWRRILHDFERFSAEQIHTMGAFPEADYHFINLILPTAFYHGVEHRNSTMVVLGPDDEGEGLYTDLLGVSSHELFHAWNVIRIRPLELLPYDFTGENYFPTCFVAEGCTTYYGDLFLRRSRVFNDEAYLRELQVYMKRHFENAASASQSLVESSFDLWLDGYEKGIPNRKVSVYQKGALVALILDLFLRKKFAHQRSMDDVMRTLWQRYGLPFVGYTLEDYIGVVREIAEERLDWYWEECIFGNAPLEHRLNEALSFVGLQMTVFSNGNVQLNLHDDPKAATQRGVWLASLQPDIDEYEDLDDGQDQ